MGLFLYVSSNSLCIYVSFKLGTTIIRHLLDNYKNTSALYDAKPARWQDVDTESESVKINISDTMKWQQHDQICQT